VEAPRRLDIVAEAQNSIGAITGVKDQADKNSRAISKIVPTWQAVEGTAVEMCPSVLATKDTITQLQCRTTEFVSKAGLATWVPSQVGDIVLNCPAERPSTTEAVSKGCPEKVQSANVKDVLGENSQILGWAMAVAGVCGVGVCGGGVAYAAKKKNSSDDSDDYDEDEEDEEGAGSPLKD